MATQQSTAPYALICLTDGSEIPMTKNECKFSKTIDNMLSDIVVDDADSTKKIYIPNALITRQDIEEFKLYVDWLEKHEISEETVKQYWEKFRQEEKRELNQWESEFVDAFWKRNYDPSPSKTPQEQFALVNHLAEATNYLEVNHLRFCIWDGYAQKVRDLPRDVMAKALGVRDDYTQEERDQILKDDTIKLRDKLVALAKKRAAEQSKSIMNPTSTVDVTNNTTTTTTTTSSSNDNNDTDMDEDN